MPNVNVHNDSLLMTEVATHSHVMLGRVVRDIEAAAMSAD
jgi:hypothetical protein